MTAAEERAAVVAWLREERAAIVAWLRRPETAFWVPANLADAIEDGDHREAP